MMLFAVELGLNGLTPHNRLPCVTSAAGLSSPLLKAWLYEQRSKLSGWSNTAKALAYCRTRWVALTRFLDDGRLCMSNKAGEREIRPRVRS